MDIEFALPTAESRAAPDTASRRPDLYSQNGEQDFVLEFFKGQQTGFFVDIGASDGVHHSNTRSLALRGWRGALIEPVPELFWRLQDTYANSDGFQLINAAIANTDGYGKMRVVRDGVTQAGIDDRNTLDARVAENLTKEGNCLPTFDSREARLMSVKTLLSRLGRQHVDFLSVDTQGTEPQIVRGLIDAGVTPKLILWEGQRCRDEVTRLENFLLDAGYAQVFQNQANRGWSIGI